MITIKVYGIDPYLLNDLSRDMTSKLANLYEISKDEINFFAPECLYVHDGVDQNTYSILVEVHAPKKVSVLEEDAYKIIENYIKNVTVHLECIFYYFSIDNYHKFENEDYPRYMDEENSVDFYEESEEETTSNEDIYLGNAFEGFEEKLEKAKKENKDK